LDHLFQIGAPVVFLRVLIESVFFQRATRSCVGLRIFNRIAARWYSKALARPRRSCEPFTELLNSGALAGFAGDSDCLSPLVDVFRRHDKVTCPGETPASRAGDNVSTNEIHCAVSKTSKLCKEEARRST
jgi:hypothetical protein